MGVVHAIRSIVLLGVGLLAACSTTPEQATELVESTTTTQVPLTSASVDVPATTATSDDQQPTTMTEEDSEPAVQCITITNFEDAEANDQWQVVNDNVMGGRSVGDRAFANGTMVFSGAINTDGGGFSSLRLPLLEPVLDDADRIVLRARSDGRSYFFTAADDLEGRQRVSFRAPIVFRQPGEWESVTVLLEDLFPVINGQSVVSEPFRRDLATRLGVILSDGSDGEFALEIDSISACAPGE